MGKIKKTLDDKEKKQLVVEQDLKIVKALAGNNKKLRDRVLKNLRKWFDHRSSKIPFTEEDFIRVWKGLFYTMWMADKPLVQEECAEKIAKLIHFSDPESSLLFFKCALIVMTTEWFGIDQLRLDKFLMFIRRILRQALEVLKRSNWELELVTEFGNFLLETVLKKNNSTHLGLTMHVTEIYLEELAKVSNGELEKHLVAEFIKPFVKQLSTLEDNRQITHMRKYLFHYLLRQSDEGMEYNVRFDAWKQRGFPGGTIESMQKVEVSDDEDMSDVDEGDEYDLEEKPLDPRAGHVDVDLPQLQFDAQEVSQLLLEHKFAEGSTSQTRKVITKLVQDFEKLSKGVFPLGIKEIRFPEHDGYSTALKKSVNRFVKFEKQLLADSTKNRKRKLKNRKADNLKKAKTDTELPGMAGMFQDQLQKFIAKSEGNLTNGASAAAKKRKLNLDGPKAQKRKASKKPPKDDARDDCKYENHFRRNSGMWFVHRYDDLDNSRASERADSFVSDEKDDSKNNLGKDNVVIENGDINLTPKINKTRNHNEPLFPQTEWDLPPKEGEVEIFVPSNKFKKKMERTAEKTGNNVNDLLNNSIRGIKTRYSLRSNDSDSFNNLAKKRLSLDAYLVKNPFSKRGITPKGEKRVKIDLKLNKSQEIHEHEAQLRSSPAIPYDANKRPSKPLLKPNAVSSPINPFYKRKLKL